MRGSDEPGLLDISRRLNPRRSWTFVMSEWIVPRSMTKRTAGQHTSIDPDSVIRSHQNQGPGDWRPEFRFRMRPAGPSHCPLEYSSAMQVKSSLVSHYWKCLKCASACRHAGAAGALTAKTGVIAAFLLASSVLCSSQAMRPSGTATPSTGANAAVSLNGSSLTDEPIYPGETVYISIFDAPDFSVTARVSQSGDIAYPMLGVIHLAGLSSAGAADLLARQLKDRNLINEPHVSVTVDSTLTGITVLGEVRSPGVYSPPGKRLLSDLLATAGGLTANTGRIIEISSERAPDEKTYIPWDPTMHNTGTYDRPVAPGDRVLVRACGFAYVGGNVIKPGAYSLCGSQKMLLSQVIALAGGTAAATATRHTLVIRTNPDGTRTSLQVDLKNVLKTHAADLVIHEDDIIYVPPSGLKATANRLETFGLGFIGTLLYVYH